MTDVTDWDDDILGEDAADEGLIELTDIVDKDSETPEDEGVIDLTEVVEEKPKESAPLELEIDSGESLEDDFLSGEEISSDDEIAVPALGGEDSLLDDEPMPEPEDSFLADDNDQDMASEALFEEDDSAEAPEIPLAAAPMPATDEAVSTNVSMEDLEAALERVIEKKFSDKIETILFEVMERVIEKEIAQIKESLQKDLDQIGNS